MTRWIVLVLASALLLLSAGCGNRYCRALYHKCMECEDDTSTCADDRDACDDRVAQHCSEADLDKLDLFVDCYEPVTCENYLLGYLGCATHLQGISSDCVF